MIHLECIDCGNPKVENQETGKCASCGALDRRAAKVKASDNNSPIAKMSPKTAKINQRYLTRLRTWKKGKKCEANFVHDCSSVITCHHMFGRGNHYHDEWAEENDVPLTLDERFWKPLCLNAHQYVTENSKFANENGYSYLRITDPIFRTSEPKTI